MVPGLKFLPTKAWWALVLVEPKVEQPIVAMFAHKIDARRSPLYDKERHIIKKVYASIAIAS